MPKKTLARVKAKQERRSPKARAIDAAQTAKDTVGQRSRDGLGRWMKSPRRTDVTGVDTKGHGKAKKVISIKPSKMKGKAPRKRGVSIKPSRMKGRRSSKRR